MIKHIEEPSDELLDKLVDASHGYITKDYILDMLEDNAAEIVKADQIITGILKSEDALSFFGFHGKLSDKALNDLNEYTTRLASITGRSRIEFITPHRAWERLLKDFGYKTTLIVYSKEL